MIRMKTSNIASDAQDASADTPSIDLAFLGSLVPGIVHNLATPMSGVLGATQLIENRNATLSDIIASLQLLDESQRSELLTQFDRGRASVDILARNARHLAELLQVIVQRLNRGATLTREFYSLNDLIQNEVRFLESDLSFKHKVKKQLVLAPDLPSSKFVYGHVAAAVDAFVTDLLSRHNFEAGPLEIEFTTEIKQNSPCLILTARYASNEADEASEITKDPGFVRLENEGWTVEWNRILGELQVQLLCPKASSPA